MIGFIMFVVLLVSIEIVGKATLLLNQDATRNLKLVPIDIAVELVIVCWGVWLLAKSW